MTQAVQATRSEQVVRSRTVERLVSGVPTSDGAGVKLNRVLTQDLQRRLDPFLMLDAFGSDEADDYIRGFPDHPHRGFETVTYMIAGQMRHRDSYGNEGLLQNGGVQWMTAGKGVVHSELPEQAEGRMEGFQLWLNLPAKDKMIDPWYRDIQSPDIPEIKIENARVRVIAGASHGIQGAMQRAVTEPLYLDIHFEGPGAFRQALPAGANAFIYVYRGNVRVGEQAVPEQTMGLLRNDPEADGVLLETDGPAKALLIAGKPLNEPIAQHGPFVMNTRQELIEAFEDFQAGMFGNQQHK
ncbi:pirin family protein [Pusillimonas sp.]|uniref:pirin family protein n=1 Tax=Pusillimonas sp. TaxID=3040095 RepID=UPI0037CBD54A